MISRAAAIIFIFGASGCGQSMPMLNGKPLLDIAQVDASSFVATGQAEYSSRVCLKNAAVRYCLHHFNEGATVTMLSPPDGNSGQALFVCSGPASNPDLIDLDTLSC